MTDTAHETIASSCQGSVYIHTDPPVFACECLLRAVRVI